MRIHHLNCGTDCPVGGALFDGRSLGPLGRIVCHCLLIETAAHGLVLVDTGYGLRDVAHPHTRPDPRITLPWRLMLNIRLHERDTAIRQIEALGHRASDVRHIIATHLDFDHAGGLEDFPDATVHVMAREYDDATGPHTGVVARNRWRRRQFDGVRNWRRYGARGEAWFGFDAVRDLDGLPPEILMVPLPGHTWGHAGVAVRRDDGWLLHAGDAYFYRGEMRGARRRCTPGPARLPAADGGRRHQPDGQPGAAARAVGRAPRHRHRHLYPRSRRTRTVPVRAPVVNVTHHRSLST